MELGTFSPGFLSAVKESADLKKGWNAYIHGVTLHRAQQRVVRFTFQAVNPNMRVKAFSSSVTQGEGAV